MCRQNVPNHLRLMRWHGEACTLADTLQQCAADDCAGARIGFGESAQQLQAAGAQRCALQACTRCM